ncbi:hypothetical protein K505DRAFT_250411 [Melanomma pulvis-pyrius CBS 109.77]|uniref:Zona occludens toxin N-terminal domain-containing protein n=1 Tax=Melanomma pulvis-pyrius CBS 109.77 TaxID=1314802 RepID=A0A6A6X356_9PLEO|nr:hypothetical protein K505DRAFT_250411 [Melanomma pulvis-pyrius CBS 109.77]
MLSFGDTEALFRARIAERKLKGTEQKKGGIQAQQSLAASSSAKVAGAGSGLLDLSEHAPPATSLKPSVSANSVTAANRPANNDLLTTTFNSFRIANGSRVASDDEYTETDTSHDDYEECEYSEVLEDNNLSSDEQKRGIPYAPDYDHIDLLVPDEIDHDHTDERYAGADAEIKHAPIISGDMITDEHQELLPQYGFLGLGTRDKSKLFLNTNVPFSAFICGVQGSGKSHTTSCLLENVLIPSKHLGRLENPLSALVFSYGHFSGDGSGFNISEVASLAAAHPSFAGHPHVKKITVLVSPSNPSIAKLYRKVPNVTVIPYKLKPWNLDIDIMLTLMAVNESDDQPLYMAQVTNILRDMATNGDGRLNYGLFKKRIEQCNFNPVQVNMLQLRLNLLESFLDLKNTCSEPSFRPGEITIMDMSCPFVDANTACILFKIGLQRYLQSNAPGKMIVLDEAHKYMLRNPGAIALNENLLQVIRLQRHFGARVIISTQEPTLLTDLIALCSITIIHRFSSPEWFSALKKHIPMSIHDHTKLLLDIEGLRTGTALVYSTGAVLGKNEDGSLIKGTGKMIRVAIRKRVTSDGGQSVLAV